MSLEIAGERREEEELNEQIAELERGIVPEINRYYALKDDLKSVQEQQQKYVEGVQHYDEEIEKTNQGIVARREEIEEARQKYLCVISQVDQGIQQLRADTQNNKEIHAHEIEQVKEEIESLKGEKGTLHEELAKLKGAYEKVKNNQCDKRRKIENKSRMFLGLLKH